MASIAARVPSAVETALPWNPAVLSGAFVAATGADQGGYFPTTWGWAALGLLGVLLVLLLFAREVRIFPSDLPLLAGLCGLVVWEAASTAWSESVPLTRAQTATRTASTAWRFATRAIRST